MIKRDCYEILMWSDGDEGRLWEWRSGKWRVLEYYNYRHTFEENEINIYDMAKLRKHFNISDDSISDAELLQFSPDDLARISTKESM